MFSEFKLLICYETTKISPILLFSTIVMPQLILIINRLMFKHPLNSYVFSANYDMEINGIRNSPVRQ